MTNFPEWLWDYVPHWVTFLVAGTAALAYITAKVSHSQDGVRRLWSKLTDWLESKSREEQRRNRDVDFQIADLWRQVQFLEEQLAELRLRDEMYWAWILTDQEWHRRYEFHAAEQGLGTIPHISFMDFRERWMTQRYGRQHENEGEAPF